MDKSTSGTILALGDRISDANIESSEEDCLMPEKQSYYTPVLPKPPSLFW